MVNSSAYHIRFYDGTEGLLSKTEAHFVEHEKFENIVDYILKLEERWKGETIIARDDQTGTYRLGKKISIFSNPTFDQQYERFDKMRQVFNINIIRQIKSDKFLAILVFQNILKIEKGQNRDKISTHGKKTILALFRFFKCSRVPKWVKTCSEV